MQEDWSQFSLSQDTFNFYGTVEMSQYQQQADAVYHFVCVCMCANVNVKKKPINYPVQIVF